MLFEKNQVLDRFTFLMILWIAKSFDCATIYIVKVSSKEQNISSVLKHWTRFTIFSISRENGKLKPFSIFLNHYLRLSFKNNSVKYKEVKISFSILISNIPLDITLTIFISRNWYTSLKNIQYNHVWSRLHAWIIHQLIVF